ncbi:hypothetical protein ABFS82_13G024900 [Erythranthe guttata]
MAFITNTYSEQKYEHRNPKNFTLNIYCHNFLLPSRIWSEANKLHNNVSLLSFSHQPEFLFLATAAAAFLFHDIPHAVEIGIGIRIGNEIGIGIGIRIRNGTSSSSYSRFHRGIRCRSTVFRINNQPLNYFNPQPAHMS